MLYIPCADPFRGHRADLEMTGIISLSLDIFVLWPSHSPVFLKARLFLSIHIYCLFMVFIRFGLP